MFDGRKLIPSPWLEVFLDGKGAFFNGNEYDDSDNDNENYNKNNKQQQLS